MRRSRLLSLPSLVSLAGCVPSLSSAPVPAYGGMRDPFAKQEAQAAQPDAPTLDAPAAPKPAEPKTAEPKPAPDNRKHCGPACALCSRAAESCDDEVRVTGTWAGPQCQRKEQICTPLTALQNATGCRCD